MLLGPDRTGGWRIAGFLFLGEGVPSLMPALGSASGGGESSRGRELAACANRASRPGVGERLRVGTVNHGVERREGR